MEQDRHDVAQVCFNGHVVTDLFDRNPEDREAFCATCGAQTMTTCQACGSNIRGAFVSVQYFARSGTYIPSYSFFERLEQPPPFCIHCGEPFAWTQAAINAAHQLADELDQLNEEDRELLKKSIDELLRDTPTTSLAGMRVKRLMLKSGPQAMGVLRDILINVLSQPIADKVFG